MPTDTLTPSLPEPSAPVGAAVAPIAPSPDEGGPSADPPPETAGAPDASPFAPPAGSSGRSHRTPPARAVEDPMTGREIALSVALILFGIAFTAATVYVYLVYL